MLSRRFQKSLVREIALLVGRRSNEEQIATEARANIDKINIELVTLKNQLGFDPEAEQEAMPGDDESRVADVEESAPDDLTIPAFLKREARGAVA